MSTEIRVTTRVKSITLEQTDQGEVEKCVLMLAEKTHPIVQGAYLVMDFVSGGRGSLHVGQELDLVVTLRQSA